MNRLSQELIYASIIIDSVIDIFSTNEVKVISTFMINQTSLLV